MPLSEDMQKIHDGRGNHINHRVNNGTFKKNDARTMEIVARAVE